MARRSPRASAQSTASKSPVPEFRLTRNADADMDGIADYTRRKHGDRQLALYLNGLETCFARLAEHPGLGTACDGVRPDLREQRHEHHVVFFVAKPYGVRIIRVLHERMDRRRHEFTDEEDE